MPRVTQLGHVGIYVNDLAKMRDFYARVLGLTVTDQDENRGIVFLSSRPDAEHHELAIVRGRTAPSDSKWVQQISWHVESLDDLLEFHGILKNEAEVSIEREVTHGIAIGIYFLDPEGNQNEVYWSTKDRVPQPFGVALDLDQPAEDVLKQAQAALAKAPVRA